jgi:tripartite-type tricarboxylate transporter receptor subunit TctC
VEKFSWLGVAQSDHDVCIVMTRTGIKNANQFLHSEKPIRIGSTAVGDSVLIRPTVAGEAAGANFKIILGYGGTSDMRLAMQTGETDAACWSWESMRVTAADLMKAKEAIPILQVTFERQPDLPDVPNILEFPMSDDAKSMLKLVMGPGMIAKLFAAPPGVPQNILDILRKGFADTLKDPDFLAEAKKVNIPISYTSPEQIMKITKEMISTPQEIKNRVAAMVRPK